MVEPIFPRYVPDGNAWTPGMADARQDGVWELGDLVDNQTLQRSIWHNRTKWEVMAIASGLGAMPMEDNLFGNYGNVANRLNHAIYGSGTPYFLAEFVSGRAIRDATMFSKPRDGNEVVRDIRVQYDLLVSGRTTTSGFTMPTDPYPMYVLTSDAAGNAHWGPPVSGNVTFTGFGVVGTGTVPYIPKWVSVSGLGDSQMWDDGDVVWVTKKISTPAFGMTTNPSHKYILKSSDDAGNAEWGRIVIDGEDHYLPKFYEEDLVKSRVWDDGTTASVAMVSGYERAQFQIRQTKVEGSVYKIDLLLDRLSSTGYSSMIAWGTSVDRSDVGIDGVLGDSGDPSGVVRWYMGMRPATQALGIYGATGAQVLKILPSTENIVIGAGDPISKLSVSGDVTPIRTAGEARSIGTSDVWWDTAYASGVHASGVWVSGRVTTTYFKMPAEGKNNYVLTSDEDGEGTWQPTSTVIGQGLLNRVARWNPIDTHLTYGNIHDANDGSIGIFTDSPYSGRAVEIYNNASGGVYSLLDLDRAGETYSALHTLSTTGVPQWYVGMSGGVSDYVIATSNRQQVMRISWPSGVVTIGPEPSRFDNNEVFEPLDLFATNRTESTRMEVTSGDLSVFQGTPITITGLDQWVSNISSSTKEGYDHLSTSMSIIYACAWDRKVLDVYRAGSVPQLLSTSTWETGTPVATYCVRNILYLVASGLYADCITLRTYDVTDPSAMTVMDGCSFQLDGIVPFDIDVAGDYAYVATISGIVVFNVADPACISYSDFVCTPPVSLPTPVTSYVIAGSSDDTVYSIRRYGEYLLACGRAGFFAVEL